MSVLNRIRRAIARRAGRPCPICGGELLCNLLSPCGEGF